MKKLSISLLAVLLLTSCIDNSEPLGIGVSVKKLGKLNGFSLKECYKKNCVSSQPEITDKNRLIDPIKIMSNKEIAFEKIMKIILKEQDINIINSTDKYIRAQQTLYGKIITDIEFYFGRNKNIQVRAQVRGLPYDLGNSKKVIERIRFKFHQNDY